MRSVVAGWSAVPLLLRPMLNPRTAIVVSIVDRLGPRVGSSKQRTGPPAREQHLQAIVSSSPVGLDRVYVCLQPELDEERTATCSSSRRARVDVNESHLIDSARSNITDLTDKPPRQFTLDEEVEGVNFLAPRRFWKRCGAGVCRERKNALAEIRRSARVNQPLSQSGHGNERVGCAVESDGRHGPNVSDWKGIPYILKRPRVGGLAITSAKHGLVVPTKCNPDTWQELTRSGFGAAVERNAAQATREDFARVRVEAVDAGVVFPRNAKKLPAQTIGQRQTTTDLPMVARVKRVLLPPNGVRVAQLVHFARLRWHTEQEVGPAMKELALGNAGCVPLLACCAAAEAERSTHRLKSSALRLE